ATAYLILDRLDYLKSESQLESVISRESSFLFNNLILLASCFAVLWGTLFPKISEWISGDQISLDAEWYNRLMVPIGLFLLFLTGVGPLFAWRRTSADRLRRNFQWPGIAALVLVVALFAAGIHQPYPLISFGFCLFVALTVIVEFYKGARSIAAKRFTGPQKLTLRGYLLFLLPFVVIIAVHPPKLTELEYLVFGTVWLALTGVLYALVKRSMNLLRATFELTHRNTRRYGGYLVHMGVVLIFIGFTGHAFNRSEVKEMSQGDTMRIGHYELRMASLEQGDNPNYMWSRGIFQVSKDGQPLGTLRPEKRFFKASKESTSEVAIRQRLNEDLYVNFGGMSDDGQRAVIQAFVNPLVTWVWLGGLVLIGGTLVCLVPSKVNMQYARTQVVGIAKQHVDLPAKQ